MEDELNALNREVYKEPESSKRWLMRDNHTFMRLSLDNNKALRQIELETSISKYASLFYKTSQRVAIKDVHFSDKPFIEMKSEVIDWLKATKEQNEK